jgi:hypothetical protein
MKSSLIFSRELTALASTMATMRSLLWGPISSVGGQFAVTIYKCKSAHGYFPCTYLLWIVDVIVHGHGEEIRCTSNLMDQKLEVLNLPLVLCSTIQVPLFFFIDLDTFRSVVPERWILWHVHGFVVGRQIQVQHEDRILALVFDGAMLWSSGALVVSTKAVRQEDNGSMSFRVYLDPNWKQYLERGSYFITRLFSIPLNFWEPHGSYM